MITVKERQKAHQLSIPNSPSAIKLKEKLPKIHNKKITMSKGEKDLYHNVSTI